MPALSHDGNGLHHATEQFQLLLEQVSAYAVFFLDPSGTIRTWNPGAERIFQYAAAEIIGHSLARLATPEDLKRGFPETELQTARERGQASDDRWHLRKDGTRIWVNGVSVALRDAAGQLRGFGKICRELTAEKKSEELLRQQARLLDLVRVMARERDGTITLWTQGMEQLYGWSAQEAIGQVSHKLLCTEFPRPLQEIEAELEQTGHWEGELTHCVRDGRKIIVTAHWVLQRDEEGRPGLVLESCKDITERRQLEERLQEADCRKDVFLATLAHELRNPLAPLLNGLHILRMRGASDPAALDRCREMMERQVHLLAHLVDDLLDVSRIARGKVQLNKEKVDLAAVVGRAVETSGPLIRGRGHHLDVELASEPLRLDGDPLRLGQVVSNLLNNAAKYTPDGGHLQLTAQYDDGEIVLRVRDNGIGIAPEMLPRVFELFEQAQPTRGARTEGGLGIGLTLVKSLVEMHGGRVEAQSAGLGQGSEFVVHLPALRQAPPEPAAEAGGKPAAVASSQRVLVVEDNVDSAESTALILRMLGHNVRTVHDSNAALRVAAEFRPGLILLDIGLPGGLSGLDLAPRLRALPGLEDVMLVATTGYGQEEDRQLAERAGFNQHLTKPFSLEALQGILAERAKPPQQ